MTQGCDYDYALDHRNFQIAHYEHRLYWVCWGWRERLYFYLENSYQSLLLQKVVFDCALKGSYMETEEEKMEMKGCRVEASCTQKIMRD